MVHSNLGPGRQRPKPKASTAACRYLGELISRGRVLGPVSECRRLITASSDLDAQWQLGRGLSPRKPIHEAASSCQWGGVNYRYRSGHTCPIRHVRDERGDVAATCSCGMMKDLREQWAQAQRMASYIVQHPAIGIIASVGLDVST